MICRQVLLASEIMVCIGTLLSFNVVIPYSVLQYVGSGLITFVSAEVLEGNLSLLMIQTLNTCADLQSPDELLVHIFVHIIRTQNQILLIRCFLCLLNNFAWSMQVWTYHSYQGSCLQGFLKEPTMVDCFQQRLEPWLE